MDLRAGKVTQVVERLPSKLEVLSSSPTAGRKEGRKERKEREHGS
jgi:hypothetical protein